MFKICVYEYTSHKVCVYKSQSLQNMTIITIVFKHVSNLRPKKYSNTHCTKSIKRDDTETFCLYMTDEHKTVYSQ